ncbi:cupin domain-containing protein [Winogradskyella tangerina]|uniref:cupin domain-containing protein n=1 Tax=Winogradskyella tangerina TaxID=2023240 RepID=UPI000DBEA975|nr:cupin domain-containing protein [Winogradskyella tangerina]
MERHKFLKSIALCIGTISVGLKAFPLNLNNTNRNLNKITDSGTLKPLVIKNDEGKQQIVLGDHQTVKLSGQDTNNQFTLIEQFNSPGMEIPLHVHSDEDEIFHVLEGELEIQIGSEIKNLKAGDLCFCPRGIPHSWKVIGESKAKVLLSIFPSGLELLFAELAQLPSGEPDFSKVAEICKKYNIKFV